MDVRAKQRLCYLACPLNFGGLSGGFASRHLNRWAFRGKCETVLFQEQNMKNNWFSKKSKFYPLIVLVILTVVQFLYAQWSVQSYRNFAERSEETLNERMREDNVPSEIKQHILYVQSQSTFNAGLLVNSLTSMQIFFQFNILLVFYYFFSGKYRKSDSNEQSE